AGSRTRAHHAGAHRGRSNGRTSDPHRPACGRAATRLGPGGAGLDAVRPDRRDALVRRAVRPQAVRRHGGRARHGGRTPRAGGRAWTRSAPTVATPSSDALFALKRFADMAGARGTPDARRVRGLALARYGEMAPEPEAARAWADAARAFVEAGDRAAARDVLERVARDSSAPPDVQQLAQSAVVEALIDGGQLDEAARQLARDGR